MVERRNFGQGTCPEPGCGKTVRLTAEGVIRQHGPRKDPCPGSGKSAREDAGPDATPPTAPEPEPETVDNRPTAAEFRAAQETLQRDGLTAAEADSAQATVNMATQYGTRPNAGPGEQAPGSASEWAAYRVREQKHYRSQIGEPDGPGDGTIRWAEQVALGTGDAPDTERQRAVAILFAANLDKLAVVTRERLQEIRADRDPAAPRDFNLDLLMRRAQANPHRAPLAIQEMRPDDGRTPEQQAAMDARRVDPMGHLLQELQRATPTPEQPVNPFDAAPLAQPAPVPTLSQPNPGSSTLNPDVPSRGPFDVVAPSRSGMGSYAPAPAGNLLPFDAAPPPAPVSTVRGGKGVRPGPEDSDFNQWKQYKIPDPETGKVSGRQRVTTFAKLISDQYQLGLWQQRVLLQGAGLRPDLAALALGKAVSRNMPNGEKDVPFLDDLVERVKEAAGASEAAAHGTTVHTYTEHADMGLMTESEWATIPDVIKRDLIPYQAKLAEAGLVPIPEMVERTTIVRSLDVCGTLDRIFRLPNGDHVIGDVKTGQKLEYAWLDIGIQLACYAHGVNENGVFDWGERKWLPAPKVREDFAIVMHVPAGGQTCTLYRVDLTTGWAHAVLARSVRDARKVRNLATVLDLEAPEFKDAGEVAYGRQFAPEPGLNPILSGPAAGMLQATQAAPLAESWTTPYDGHNPVPVTDPWPTNLPPIPAPGTIPLAIDTPRPVQVRPDMNNLDPDGPTGSGGYVAPLTLVTGGPTLPHLVDQVPVQAPETDPMEEMRNMARTAMSHAIQQSDMARVYETAMGVFPPGDRVFGELAEIGTRNQSIPY